MNTPRTEFTQALKAIATERGLDPAVIIDTIKQAIIAAYRRDAKERGEETETFDYDVELDPVNGEAKVFSWPLVAEDASEEEKEKAKKERKDVTPPGFGRIAAQTAKQVIHQKIREAEKGEGLRGKELILSRADPEFVKKLFAREVPEISSGSVVIKIIAREPGVRTKIAVFSNQSGVDPVGSCVGQKGVRVQAVTNELGGERVDIVPWSENLAELIESSLSPAENLSVTLDEETKTAHIKAPEDQLSLAIGRDGQNARLSAKLTGWRIEVESTGELSEVEEKPKTKKSKEKKIKEEKPKSKKVAGKKKNVEKPIEEDKTKKGEEKESKENTEKVVDNDTQS